MVVSCCSFVTPPPPDLSPHTGLSVPIGPSAKISENKPRDNCCVQTASSSIFSIFFSFRKKIPIDHDVWRLSLNLGLLIFKKTKSY